MSVHMLSRIGGMTAAMMWHPSLTWFSPYPMANIVPPQNARPRRV